MQCEICGGFFKPVDGDTYNGKFVCDNCQLIIKALGGEVANMLKSTYDTDDSGVVDDAEDSQKLDGSTKTEVQDHNTTLAKVTDHDTKVTTPHVSAAEKTAWNAKIANVGEDTTPQLGGNLDCQDKIVQKADYVEVKERTAPATPASGYGRVFEKADGKLYFINDAGVETELTAGGGGGATFTVSGAQVYSGNSPTSWTDLDLSSIVGSNSAMVILAFRGNIDINALAVRKNGDTNEYYNASAEGNAYGCALGHHDSVADLVLICVTDTAGKIEWKAESAVVCTVDVIAYIK